MAVLKRLVVNADDLGRTAGVNRGVVQAHRTGVVTSATLMVAAPAAGEGGSLLRENPELGVGLHLALTGGVPCLPPEQVPSLVDGAGRLPAKPEGLSGADAQQILAEARAQLKRFRNLTGAFPTHLDSHHHAHALPEVLEALVTLAWETGLPVRSISAGMRERLRREGVPTPDHFIEGFYGQGATLENLVRLLSQLEPGLTELMCHPAVVDEALRSGSSYAEERSRELSVLTHGEVRQAIQAAGIRLVHFGDL